MRFESGCLAVLTILVQWSLHERVQGFNLEPRIPIVKIGPKTSHFGYSVAQHKALLSSTNFKKQYESWILVGAPKGENLQPGTNRSGALFKCPLTTRLNDCQQVQTDGLKNANGLYKGNPDGTLMGPSEDEIKDDQWMGVTLKSQGEGGDILVCGHRYQHKGIGEQNFRWGYGLCYRLKNNFEYQDNYQPCMGKPVDLEHEQFGYCQAGTSGLILDDEVVLGIPGTYTWRGTVHTRNITDDYLLRDKTQYFGVYTDDDSPVNKYSYLGYSVAAGRFFGQKLSYVAGAPRSRGTGQVIFFSRERMGNPIMNYDLILNGEMFASSFGFEVLALDVNGDSLDDLIVSAPFYFTKQSSGAVYVYLNDGQGISNETPFTRLEGAPGESRFGFSMTSLGDLNLDGYNDLAVGAPYEGRGAIYIFLGSENGIIKEPSQVIRAEDLPGIPYDAFGYALSGGMDLDNNNYNDLLTSAFCSDRVILLRARPIIDIQTKVESENLQNINPTKAGCPEDRDSPEACFSVSACFKMMNEAGTQTFLSLQYTISERFYNDQPTNRIRFHLSQEDKQSTIERIINLRPEKMGSFQCSREIVYIKKDQRDVLRPVRFKLSYKIAQRDPIPVIAGQPMPDINDYPILNQKEAVRYFEANFAKDCGADDICISDLKIVGELDLETSPGEDFFVLELGKRQYFALSVIVSNNGEPAYVPNLYVSHDEAIHLSIKESQTGSYQCFPVDSGLLKCNLENPLVNTTGTMRLVFKLSGLPFKSKYISLRALVNSTSEESYEKDNRIEFVLEVKRRAEISISGSAEPEQVFYSGEVVGESAIESVEEIGTNVIHKYLVDNRGPWKVDKLEVLVHWPFQVENNKKQGKWLLYMTDIPIVDGDGECDVNPDFINPLVLRQRKPEEVQPEAVIGSPRPQTIRPLTTPFPGGKPGVVITTKRNRTVIETKIQSTKEEHSSGSFSSKSDGVDGQNFGNSNRINRKSSFSKGSRGRIDNNDKSTGSNKYNSESDFGRESRIFGSHSGTGDSDSTHGYSETHRSYASASESKNYGKRVPGKDSLVDDLGNLDAVSDIKTVREGKRTYVNGYDGNGRLVWSSRSLFRKLPSEIGTDTESRWNKEFEDHNEKMLTKKIESISDFQISRDENGAWVNGYDEARNLVWSSRPTLRHSSVHSSNRESNIRGHDKNNMLDRDESDGTSVQNKYYYSERTSVVGEPGETKRKWSSTIQDHHGTRTQSGSSVTDEDGTRITSGTHPDSRFHGSYAADDILYLQNKLDSLHSTSGFQNDAQSLHALNYSRAVLDPLSGSLDVLIQKIFSRKSDNQWQKIHGPFNDENWSVGSGSREPLRRVRRERAFVVKSQAITDAQTGKTMEVVTFQCDGPVPTAKCFTFRCTIRNLAADQSASIRIRSRLWNATLIEDYPHVSFVSIRSKGELLLPDEIRSDQDTTDDVAYANTLAYSNLLEQLPPQQVPWWVILISVLAGLVLLLLIAGALWKFGFFKRRRPDPTYSGNINRDANGYN